jgi:hypothetical protein
VAFYLGNLAKPRPPQKPFSIKSGFCTRKDGTPGVLPENNLNDDDGFCRSFALLEIEDTAMLHKIMWFSLILSLTSVALAQEPVRPSSPTMTVQADSTHATQTCQVNYSSGTVFTSTQLCVTVNGNIPLFTVRGQKLFPPAGDAADLEGYGFCDVTAGVRYMDYAAYDNDAWNASTLQQNGNTVTVTRTTADGNWQLTQTIVNVPATASAVGSAKVTMKLKNLTSVARSVNLLRYAAENVDGGKNDFNATEFTASGQFPYGAGLMISVNSFPAGFGQEAYVQNVQSGPDPCAPLTFEEPTMPFVGFGSIVAEWETSPAKKIARGGTATVVSTYRGF